MTTSKILSFIDYSSFRTSLKSIEERSTCTGFLYVLFTEKNGLRVSVQRLAGVDVRGILYIGQTTKLLGRVSLLHRSFQNPPTAPKLWRHGAEEIYWQCEEVRKMYPIGSMYVDIKSCESSKCSEFEAISSYCQQYGEVPPFNGAIVKRSF